MTSVIGNGTHLPGLNARWFVFGAGSILPRVQRPGASQFQSRAVDPVESRSAQYGPAGYGLLRNHQDQQRLTLFDCGPGTLRQLGRCGLALQDVHSVVLSHYHPDHCLDLFALLFARKNPGAGALPELEVIGPPGLEKLRQGGEATFGKYVRDQRTHWRETPSHSSSESQRASACQLDLQDLSLSAVPTDHTPNALAWRVDLEDGLSLAYSGDTGENVRVADLASDVDLFTAECSFPEHAATPNHLTPQSAGRLAARARCKQLVLSHFYPNNDPEQAVSEAALHFHGAISAACDGASYALGSPIDGDH